MLRLIIISVHLFTLLFISTVFAGDGAVTGRLLLEDGRPLADGVVFYFTASSSIERPVLGKFWRVPDFVDSTDSDGRLATLLPEGSYYIGAVKRMTAISVGPPVDGDYFLPSHDRKGVYRTVTVKDGETTDIGVIKGIQPYSAKRSAYSGKVTAITGRLVRPDGSPVEGMFVFAYGSPEMKERPLFVSTRSDKNGNYRLPLDKGRIVYLKARIGYAGGSPEPGVPIGFYGGEGSMKPVAARTDRVLKEIDIEIKPFAMMRK